MRGLLAILASSGVLGVFLAHVFTIAAGMAAVYFCLSQRGQAFFQDLSEAMRSRGSLKVAAIELGYNPQQLSTYLNPKQRSFLTRLSEHEPIEREFIKRRAARLGLRVVDEDVAAVLDEAVSRKKQMLK